LDLLDVDLEIINMLVFQQFHEPIDPAMGHLAGSKHASVPLEPTRSLNPSRFAMYTTNITEAISGNGYTQNSSALSRRYKRESLIEKLSAIQYDTCGEIAFNT
jgi:hypothetical protein